MSDAPRSPTPRELSGEDEPYALTHAFGFTMDETLTLIASSVLGLSTLETRRSDGLDFREHGVASIREALRAAFRAGEVRGRRAPGGATARPPRAPKPPRDAKAPRAPGKRDLIAALLTRPEGTTTQEILDATGWPAVSVPQQAAASGLTLRKAKAPGERTRYFGAPAEPPHA